MIPSWHEAEASRRNSRRGHAPRRAGQIGSSMQYRRHVLDAKRDKDAGNRDDEHKRVDRHHRRHHDRKPWAFHTRASGELPPLWIRRVSACTLACALVGRRLASHSAQGGDPHELRIPAGFLWYRSCTRVRSHKRIPPSRMPRAETVMRWRRAIAARCKRPRTSHFLGCSTSSCARHAAAARG